MGMMPADFARFVRESWTNFVEANFGISDYIEGSIHYHGTPELMAEHVLLARDAGVKIIGGCCVTSPAHMAPMGAALGEAWADDKIDNSGGNDRRTRRGRRRNT